MSKKQQWRKRTRGTSRQVGQPFILMPSGTKRANLPKVQGVRQSYPSKEIELSLRVVSTNKLIPTQRGFSEPAVMHIMDMYRRNETIPPLLVHRLPNGTYELLDGHARLEAYWRLGITAVPVVENSLFGKLSNVAKWSKEKAVAGTRKAWKVAKRVERFGIRKGKELGAMTEKAAIAGGRFAGRVAALPSEVSEAYEEAKAERPQREEEAEEVPTERSRQGKPLPKESGKPFSTPPFGASPHVEDIEPEDTEARVERSMNIRRAEEYLKLQKGKKARITVDVE